MGVQPALSFSNKDKVRTLQPYDDALVVTFRIGGYDVKRVLVDQGSGVKIMYPDLFKGLKLRPCHNGNVGGIGIYHDEVHFHDLCPYLNK